MKPFHALLIIAAIFLADQISKWWVVELIIKPLALSERMNDPTALPFVTWLLHAREQMPYAQQEIFSFFNIVMAWNKGASFGMFNQHGDYGPLLLTIMALTIVGCFSIWLLRSKSRLLSVSLAFVIGGALGNVADRVRFGAVADFLDFHAFGWHFWAFNVADSAICLGIAMLLVHSLFFDTKNKQPATDNQDNTQVTAP